MKLLIALISVLAYTAYLRIFKRAKQYEREEGLPSHKKKNGTITMGGIIFVIMPLFFITYNEESIAIAITFTLYGLLGFLDDILIIKRKNNQGLPPSLKLLLELIISGISFYFALKNNIASSINMFGFILDLKWAYGLLIMLILVSSTNAFNLTDGIDGLCSGLSLILSIPLGFIAYKQNRYEILSIIIYLDIVLFVFWCFNLPKAFLFMGDTGSLALGAVYSLIAIYLNCILAFILLALIFIFETLSVIIQVWYYKRTKKRIFKMAPFHHHLEAIGLKEYQINAIAYLIEAAIAILIILLY